MCNWFLLSCHGFSCYCYNSGIVVLIMQFVLKIKWKQKLISLIKKNLKWPWDIWSCLYTVTSDYINIAKVFLAQSLSETIAAFSLYFFSNPSVAYMKSCIPKGPKSNSCYVQETFKEIPVSSNNQTILNHWNSNEIDWPVNWLIDL